VYVVERLTHHLCAAVADRRRHGNYPKALDQTLLQLHSRAIVQIDHELRKLDEIWVGTAAHDGDTAVRINRDGDEISEENGL
jgi:hypothetical protein